MQQRFQRKNSNHFEPKVQDKKIQNAKDALGFRRTTIYIYSKFNIITLFALMYSNKMKDKTVTYFRLKRFPIIYISITLR